MTLDELLLEWSYRSERGYPTLDNPSDISVLEQILKELDLPINEIINNLEEVNLLPNQLKGLVITKIENNSPLLNSIDVNSIIVEAQKKKIKSANDLDRIVKEVLNTSQKTILLVIYNSQNQRRYIGVKLK